MNANNAKRVSYDIGCMKSLRKLPDRVTAKFMDMMTRYMSDPSTKGLNLRLLKEPETTPLSHCGLTKATGPCLWGWLGHYVCSCERTQSTGLGKAG